MTTVYLAYSSSGEGNSTLGLWDWKKHPLPILVSFHYLKSWNKFLSMNPGYQARELLLDSGAYSAFKIGATIDIDELIKESVKPCWNGGCVALDVIGDSHASVKNAVYMKSKNSPAYPVFHYGDPWEHLDFYCQNFPKIGLSCRFGESLTNSYKWLDKCFSRRWPHKFHSFGWIAEEVLMRYPFHSGDATSWAMGPAVYGRWKTFGRKKAHGMGKGGMKLPARKNYDLRSEIQYYQDFESTLKTFWKAEMRTLDLLPAK